ncbi:DNA-binding LacI/PurR family transcriptional regulator [Paenarthrobacter nitroguajacolicus]|uniref:LacI family DNA-binding transcriptional regulator n=1 Tax=Paenarthrobacter TaxID=1742992 RepID=UPI0028619C99|nr:LacI family DNA-binding transcriptional regulator [Paenarthrobacter nitroguajacolicus]MDR6988013.1 DNA-binding LacI/PurR family transcriptional regulator [Paenarthrobacter nitroguajacolicus]
MPTSKDVAQAAGVAQSTVSYVLSGKRPISEKTRKKVEDAIEQLTYQPNAGARALAGRRTHVIGLVIPFIPELEMGSIMEFVSVIASTARQFDHDILLVTEDEGAAGLRRVVGQQICDGLILMQVEDEDERLPLARSLNVPVVLIGIPRDPTGLVCIDADFEMAGRHCVQDLAAAGHEVISIIDWQPAVVARHVNYVERFMGGVDAAAEKLGVTAQHLPGGADVTIITDSVDRALASSHGKPAFIAPDRTVQDILRRALAARGLTPGVDVSVIGSASPTLAELQPIPLSTIDLRPAEVSRRAVKIICDLLEADTQGPSESLELVPTVITHRSSTLRPPHGS